MLKQRSKDAIDAYNTRLQDLTTECIEKAREIFMHRAASYNTTQVLEDFLLNGPQDILYEIHKKNLRILSMLQNESANDKLLLDNIYDIVNYAALLYALTKIQKEDDNK